MQSVEQLYIEKLNARTMQNPLNWRERVIDYKAAVEVLDFDGAIIIKSIRSFERGNGNGSMALKVLTDLADECGLMLTLTPKAFGKNGLSNKALIAWYLRNGFTQNKHSGGMVRLPITKETIC
jgi:GNAT superfamily N-acetyltransferase